MKKEWMYFIAGAVLVGAIMAATTFIKADNYSGYDECIVRELQKFQYDGKFNFVLSKKFCREL
tara:strand:- start:439 stop:627 length:189 start_codon:yes stop_codon:yes gene_type:complete